MTFPIIPGPTICIYINGNSQSSACGQSPGSPESEITVYFDNRIIFLVAAGKVFITYYITDAEAATIDLDETDWLTVKMLTDGPDIDYENLNIVGPDERPENGYTYRLFARDYEVGLGFQYPLNRYTRPVTTSVLIDEDDNATIIRQPLSTAVKEAATAYPGGHSYIIPSAHALPIMAGGGSPWITAVVPSE